MRLLIIDGTNREKFGKLFKENGIDLDEDRENKISCVLSFNKQHYPFDIFSIILGDGEILLFLNFFDIAVEGKMLNMLKSFAGYMTGNNNSWRENYLVSDTEEDCVIVEDEDRCVVYTQKEKRRKKDGRNISILS